MLDTSQLDDFVVGSRLHGHDWLLPHARLAEQNGLELTVEDAQMGGPMIRVTDLATRHWLELPMDTNTEDDTIENLIRGFHSTYAQLEPIEGDEDNPELMGESLPSRIVDVLVEGGAEEFLSSFQADQEQSGGRPLTPEPTGEKVLRAVEFSTGHKLYIWRTPRQREYYGSGPKSFYLGYRLVSPVGNILMQGTEYHPGMVGDPLGDDSILILMQGLTTSADNFAEEDIEKMTPQERAWLDDPARGELEMDLPSGDRIEAGDHIPWRDLPGYSYKPTA